MGSKRDKKYLVNDELRYGEPHPMAWFARRIVNESGVMLHAVEKALEIVSSHSRRMRIVLGTLRRVQEGKPVSDRYIMGLALLIIAIGQHSDTLKLDSIVKNFLQVDIEETKNDDQ